MKLTLKSFFKIIFPIIGIGTIAGCIIPVIVAKPNNNDDTTIVPTKINVSGGVDQINAKTNTKTIADKAFDISVEPKNASKSVYWSIVDSNGDEAPKQIYINENNKLVVDSGLNASQYDNTLWKASPSPKNGGCINTQQISFILHEQYVPSDVIDIRYLSQGSTILTSPISQITYIDKPFIAQTQSKLGIWEVGKVTYSIVSDDTDAQTNLAVDNDGYVYTTGKAMTNRSLTCQIKATAVEDNTFSVMSDTLTVIFQGDDSCISSLRFINGDSNVNVNIQTHFQSNMPYIVSAYDENGTLIPNPKLTFYLIGAPTFVNIDQYGYLDVNASNIASYSNLNFQVIARSKIKTDITVALDVNLVIADFRNNDYYKFDANTGTLLGLQPKFYSYLVNQAGILSLPNNIESTPITKIADGVFQGIKELKEIVLPNTITSIGNNEFLNCSGLSKITFNSDMTIGASALSTGTATNYVLTNQNLANHINTNYLPTIVSADYNVTRTAGDQNQGVVTHTYSGIPTPAFSYSPFWNSTSKKTTITFTAIGFSLPVDLQSKANVTPQFYTSTQEFCFNIQCRSIYSASWNIFSCTFTYSLSHYDYSWTRYTFTISSGTVSYNSGSLSFNWYDDGNTNHGAWDGGYGYRFSTGERLGWRSEHVNGWKTNWEDCDNRDDNLIWGW